MKTQTRTIAALAPAIIVALGAAAPAIAGPSDPTFRGDPNSVHAVFEWTGSTSPWVNPIFNTGPSQYPLDQTVPSASDDGLDTTVFLPNFIDPLPLKFMRIQLAFDGPVNISPDNILVEAFDPQDTDVVFVGGGSEDPNLFWYFFDFEIRPNPDWEQITIFGDTGENIVPGNLLIIEIDTVSFPTPGAISVAAFAGLATVRRRRR